MHRLKNIVLPWLPAGWVTALKRWYYPRVVRRFDPSRWPCAEAARQCIRPGNVVVDAGANIGYLSGLFSAWVGPSGTVHAFEPVPETFRLLEHNARVLKWSNVRLHPCALSNENRTAFMSIPAYEGGADNLYESHLAEQGSGTRPGERQVQVPLRRMDDCLAGQVEGRLALVKIDVEGHEAAVVHGAGELLRRHRPALVIEVNSDPDLPGSPARDMFLSLLEMGYEVFLPTSAGLRPRAAGERGIDYVFLHPEGPGRA